VKLNLTASRHILPFAAFLANRGERLSPLLAKSGLPSTCLDDPAKLVPTAALWRFRELAAKLTGASNLSLDVMAPLDLSELGPVARSLLRAPTLRKTIEDFKRIAFAESSTAILDLTPWRNADFFFSVRFNLTHQLGEWQSELYLLMWMLKIVRLVDPEWSPTEIWCIAKGAPDRVQAIESLAARPRFSQCCTGFPIPGSMLALPLGQSRPRERSQAVDKAVLWSTAPSDSTAGAVKQLIQAYADDRWLTAEQASDALGMNLRALQRQLAAEDQTYSAIFEETRAEAAASLLEGAEASLSEIARCLGYSNLSNFNRAFRRWAAVSPREFRAQRQEKRHG
jgi:AraC-like DNA-binding protein